MILYANGCSHTAAAEAAVPDVFAVDDGKHGIDRRPHPKNLAVSWCTRLGKSLSMPVICEAESGGSNPRILRTTREWVARNPDKLKDVFMVLQWTTWEREEWFHNGLWLQVNASGWDWVPDELRDQYRQFVIDVDWNIATQRCHDQIWELHQELKSLGIKHLFFNGYSTFSNIQSCQDWDKSYIDPYLQEGSYNAVLKNNGFDYVNPASFHFGVEAHSFWANYVLQYIQDHNLVTSNEISTD